VFSVTNRHENNLCFRRLPREIETLLAAKFLLPMRKELAETKSTRSSLQTNPYFLLSSSDLRSDRVNLFVGMLLLAVYQSSTAF
jgi:hypothetical protein